MKAQLFLRSMTSICAFAVTTVGYCDSDIASANVVGYANAEIKPGAQTIVSRFATLGDNGPHALGEFLPSACVRDEVQLVNEDGATRRAVVLADQDGSLHWYDSKTLELADNWTPGDPTHPIIYTRTANKKTTVSFSGEVQSMEEPVLSVSVQPRSTAETSPAIGAIKVPNSIPEDRAFILRTKAGERMRVHVDKTRRIVLAENKKPLEIRATDIAAVETAKSSATEPALSPNEVKKTASWLRRMLANEHVKGFAKSIWAASTGHEFDQENWPWILLAAFAVVPLANLANWFFLLPCKLAWRTLLKQPCRFLWHLVSKKINLATSRGQARKDRPSRSQTRKRRRKTRAQKQSR